MLLLLPALVAGCGGHHHQETASDVAERLMHTKAGPLANPASVSCPRANAKWWRCEVTQKSHPDSLGTSTAEVEVRAR